MCLILESSKRKTYRSGRCSKLQKSQIPEKTPPESGRASPCESTQQSTNVMVSPHCHLQLQIDTGFGCFFFLWTNPLFRRSKVSQLIWRLGKWVLERKIHWTVVIIVIIMVLSWPTCQGWGGGTIGPMQREWGPMSRVVSLYLGWVSHHQQCQRHQNDFTHQALANASSNSNMLEAKSWT